MRFLLQKIKYVMYLPVLVSLVVGILSLAVGVWKSVKVADLVWTSGPGALTPLLFLRIMDSFVVSAVLILFAVGLYMLFIGKLDLPDAYQTKSLHDLESKIGNLIILVMALSMLERFLEVPNDPANLPLAGAFALVTLGIIAFTNLKGTPSHGGTDSLPGWRAGRHKSPLRKTSR